MKFSYVFILAALLILPAQVVAEPTVQIDTDRKDALDNYSWITYLSSSPIDWVEEESASDVYGRSYRVVVVTSEIYNSVYLEEITIGDEGCCAKVASTRKLNLEQLYRHFGFEGEIHGFEVIGWKSPTSFEFSIHKNHFLLSGVNEDKVTVQKL